MNLLELQSDPAAFQQEICLATGSGPRRFGDIMADFQRERFAAVNSSLLAVAGHEAPPCPRVWDERTKGASKDTDWAVNLLWLLAFSRRPLRMQVGAFDAEQADEVRLIVRDILRTDGPVNAFLRQVVEVQSDKIINPRTGSVVEILTSDQFGSHGSRIDLILLNEVTHQPSSGFAETLFDNADKMPRAMGIVATNSGNDPSWQLEWKRTFAGSARWLILEHPQPAPWIAPEALAEAEKRNPPGRFMRLWHGVWSGTEGEPAISPADLAATFADLGPMTGAEGGFSFVAGLDLGIARNWSCLCVLRVKRGRDDAFGEVHLADLRVWKPSEGRRVNLLEIEKAIIDADRRFSLASLHYDPWQAIGIIQRLQALELGRMVSSKQRATTRLVEAAPTQKTLQRIATVTRECFADRRIRLFDAGGLRRDLALLQVEERPNGSFRLTSPVTADGGHGDAAAALCLALLGADESASRKIVRAGVVDADAPRPGETEIDRHLRRLGRARQRIAALPSDREYQLGKALREKLGPSPRLKGFPR